MNARCFPVLLSCSATLASCLTLQLACDAKDLIVNRTGGAEFKTLAAAAQAARPGDTIRVQPDSGPYRETLFIRTSGTAEAPIVFDGGGNLITGFEPLTAWTTVGQETTCRLPVPFPAVLTYHGERLVQDPATGQFTRYARLNEAKDTLTLLPGVGTDGWEISTRMAVVQILNTSYQTYRNVRASGSRNDGFNLHGTGTNLVFENIEGFQNLDEGFSAHDEITCEVHGAKFWGNDNGVGNVAHSDTKFTQVDTWGNLGFGFWLSDCRASTKSVRSWGNGAGQVILRNATVNIEDVQAFTPVSATRPWVSYQESRATTACQGYSEKGSQITGSVTVRPEPAPPGV